MSNDSTHETRPRSGGPLRVLLAVAAILAIVALAACGSSSSSSTSTKAAASTTARSGGANRFSALRECLQKQGIKLPSRPSGGGAPGNGAPGNGAPGNSAPGNGAPPAGGTRGFKLPEGVSRSKFREAVKNCGGGSFSGRRARPNRAATKTALTKYASCMRENGVKLPAANTSGNGPVFNTKGIDTSSATFEKAQKKCQSQLKGAFGPPSGSGQAGPANGAPPGAA